MKLIFKKRFGAFNLYSNGRVYCDLDRVGKGKKKKKPMTIEDKLIKQEEYKAKAQLSNEKTKENIENIKNCFRKFKK